MKKSNIEQESETLQFEIPALISRLKNGEQTRSLVPKTLTTKRIFRFCDDSGISLLAVLKSVRKVVGLVSENQMQVRSQLAGPKMTAKIISFLPLAGFFIGYLFSVDPVETLIFTTPGNFALVIGVIFWFVGYFSTKRLTLKMQMLTSSVKCIADHACVQLELLNALVNSGKSLKESLILINAANSRDADTWFDLKIKREFAFMKNAYISGVSPIEAINAEIENILRNELTEIKTASEQFGILLLMPLTLGYLPSFICIGVFPIIDALFSSM